MTFQGYLKADSEIKVIIGPVVAVGDGFTPVTTLSVATADEAEIMKHNAAAVTDISGNTFAAIASADGYYNLTITAAQLDTEGMLTVLINDDSLCLPVRASFMVQNANVYDSLNAAATTDYLQTDVTQIAGAAVATGTAQLGVNVVTEANIDFGALKKTSLNAATPASVTTVTGNVDGTIGSLGATAKTDVNTECDTALADYDPPTRTEATADKDAILADHTLMKQTTAGTYDRDTDSLQAVRDRGDAAWVTGGGGSISDILNIQPLVPNAIDLANTATVRISLGLTNMVDDLPTTAEITPGTITIDRKAIGGTSWSNVVNAAACSEAAGLIYYDEVFDSGTGYAAGDTVRITFKSQKITVAANDYEITGTDGWVFHTYIREEMRGTDGANTTTPDAAGTAAGLHGTTDGKIDTAQSDLNILTGVDGVTLATLQANYAPNKVVPDAAGTAAGLHGTTDGKVDAVQTDATAILLDTGTTIPGTITTLQSDSTAILLDTGTTIPGTITTLQSDSTDIKAKTDNLPSGIAKNVALSGFNVFMVLASDSVTAATGVNVTATISKDGGSFSSATNAVAEISAGMYKIDLTQTEMNADVITLRFVAATCNDRIITIYTS